MSDIKLYYNFTPNRYQYYFFTTDNAYLTAISAHLVTTESLDNARLSGFVLNVKKPESMAQYDYTRITYVREDRAGFIRYYFVTTCEYLGDGFYQYRLSPDKWANYIACASFDHIYLKRCNRHLNTLPTGRFDDIGKAIKYSTLGTSNTYVNYSALVSGDLTKDDVYIAFSVVFNSYKQGQLFANTIVTSDTSVFVVRLGDLLIDPGSPLNTIPLWWIERGLTAVGSIYAMQYSNNGGWGEELDAYVSGIWLVDRAMIPNVDSGLQIRFKTPFTTLVQDGAISVSTGLRLAHNSFISIPFTMNVDATCDLYFGTKSAMLKLPRIFDNNGQITANVECIVKKDEVQIIARCGDDQLDITSSFSLGVPNATGATSAWEKIARGVSTVGAITGAVTNAAMGKYLNAGVGAFGSGFGAISDNAPNAQYKSNGDGLTTWVQTKTPSSWSGIEYPIVYTKYKSAQGESETTRALKSGAVFNQFINSISNLFTARAVVTGVTNNTVYVQASLDVENIPVDAAEYIAERFERGIELVKVV